jgi:pimeloyl-ACP methyl ester carboxylesterase
MAREVPNFPVGFHALSGIQPINFQLNRWHSLGYLPLDEVAAAGKAITGYDNWQSVLVERGEAALAQDRLINAAFFFRAAEFYTRVDDPEKQQLYRRFVELFNAATADAGLERHEVRYGGAVLPAIRLTAAQYGGGANERGTIVLHGGFDSFAEEFSTMIQWYAAQGYDVVAFEGPGQGNARRSHGLVFDHEWEKPTGAVLDHFGLDDVTLVGLSMGGYLCLRAAAFEPRITRVVASSVPFDYTQFAGAIGSVLVKLFFKRMTGFTNSQARKRMSKDPFYNWYLSSVLYMTGMDTPVEGLYRILEMNERNLHSADIHADVLVLTGKNDHTVPFKMHGKQLAALTGARSVTGRVFTADEDADQHCQVGNVELAMRTMDEWIQTWR